VPEVPNGAVKLAAPAGTALLFFALARAAEAAEPPNRQTKSLPCRPTIACTADIVVPGALELETGALFRRVDTTGRQWTFPVLAKLTVVDWLQLQAGGNGFTVVRGNVPAQFLDDVQLGGKLHVLDQGHVAPSLSFSALASIPTFRARGYLRTYDTLLTAYVTKDLGPLHADLNVGENIWRVQAPLPQEWIALALSINLPPPFGVMAESYYFSDARPVALRDGGFLFAISQSPRPWLIFDCGGDVGMFPSTRAYSLFVGVTIVPVVLWVPGGPKRD
jgi:hypothetical protein